MLGQNSFLSTKIAKPYLFWIKSTTWIFCQSFFYYISKRLWIWNIFENFPEVLFLPGWKSFEIRIGIDCFSEWWRLHMDHKQCCSTWKNISLHAIISWINCKFSQLPVKVRVFKYTVFTLTLCLHFLLYLMNCNICVPNFRCIIHFTSDIVSFLNDWIKLLAKKVITFDLRHTCGKTKISYD